MTTIETQEGGPSRNDIILVLFFAAGALLMHLLVNAFGGYGIFRDEYYYIACSKRLAAGYVDHPPLAMWLLAASRAVFGESQFAIRVLPALNHAATVALCGLIALKLGGRKTAVVLAGLAAVLSPILAGHSGIYQMNSFAHLFWALAAYLLVLIVKQSRPGLWILLGAVMGLGLLNKIDFLWFGAGLAAGLLLTDLRRHLSTPWPYVAGAIALLMFSPYIIWNAGHGWAHLEFMRNASGGKYSGLSRIDFLKGQILLPGPANAVIWLTGLVSLVLGKGRRFRILGVVYLTGLAVLLINAHSKAEYLAPAYPMLFAAGAAAIERWAARGKRYLGVPALAVLSVATSAVILPFAMPMLPVETFIGYQRALGMSPATSENLRLAELPQFYADMFGWEGLAKDVSAVFMSLPEEERWTAVVFARNYGEAAAIEYYADRYPVPRVICPHNSYWLWGYPEKVGTLIVLRGSEADSRKSCEDVTVAATHTSRYAIPYENNMPIYICRGLRIPMATLWATDKNFN